MFTTLAIPDKPVVTPPAVPSQAIVLLRQRIARIERIHARGPVEQSLPLGIEAIDQVLPTGGIRPGALHEAASAGPDTEHAAAATLFAAGILARLNGPILWVLRQADLFAPGLTGAGLQPDRIVFVEAGKDVLSIMEEGLRHSGLAAVVAEHTGRLSMVASRRLQLAAEQSGILAILLRRSPSFDDPALSEPTAAVTSWRIAALPSPPALPHAPDTPGLGRAWWRLDLTRCRGGEPGSWIVEACDATGRLGLVSDTDGRSVRAA
ncbi:ImuA family protein [Acidisphaera sp. S103]|uniref:ImuA family protein n=1 Tax=Acidisphaera sp. S103 TaxID=1747223 RepID=UPI001C2085C2|nr:damage-inducible mutagenesis protein [Acidisphaera sp. S103]